MIGPIETLLRVYEPLDDPLAPAPATESSGGRIEAAIPSIEDVS